MSAGEPADTQALTSGDHPGFSGATHVTAGKYAER
jgi:hypothetical protein